MVFYDLLNDETARIFEQNSKMIEYKYENSYHRRILLKNCAKKKFVTAFGFQ